MLHLFSVSVNSGTFHSSQPLQSSPFPIWSTFNWSPTLSFLLQNCPLNPASPVHSLSLPEFRSSSSSIWTYSNRKTWPTLFFLSGSPSTLPPGNSLHFFFLLPMKSKFLGKAWKVLYILLKLPKCLVIILDPPLLLKPTMPTYVFRSLHVQTQGLKQSSSTSPHNKLLLFLWNYLDRGSCFFFFVPNKYASLFISYSIHHV